MATGNAVRFILRSIARELAVIQTLIREERVMEAQDMLVELEQATKDIADVRAD